MGDITERVFRRLIRESASTTGLAAIRSKDTGLTKEAIIYDIDAMEQWLQAIVSEEGRDYALDTIRGMIRIRKPGNPCDGAWEVSMSAGPGFGKQVYGAAYAMSPTGKLIPDRMSVSAAARRGWSRAQTQRKSKELDFLFPPHLTPEKDDDCRRHNDPGEEFVDRSYEAQGWEAGMLEQLQANHDEMVKRNGLTPDQELALYDALKSQVTKFFESNYEE